MATHAQSPATNSGFIPASNPLVDLLSTVEQHVAAHEAILTLRRRAQAMQRLHRKAIDAMSVEDRAKVVRDLAYQFFYEGVHVERQPVSMDSLLLEIAAEYWARISASARQETAPLTRELSQNEKTEYLALLALSESHVKLLCATKAQ